MADTAEDAILALAAGFPPAPRADWLALVERTLKGRPFDRAMTTPTHEGLTLQPLYTAGDLGAADPAGFPGAMPFVRGAADPARVTAGWQIRQLHAHPDPDAANAAIRDDLARGADAVALRLDPDGADGVMALTVDDLDRALAGVELAQVPLALAPGPHGPAAAALLLALLARRGGDAAVARLSLGLDPLGALAAAGMLPEAAPAALARFGADAAALARRLPAARAVAVDTGPYYEAGADEVTDLAVMLATGVAYLRAMEAAGLEVAAAAAQVEVTLAVGVEVFHAIAKLRAARRLWARLLEASGGPEEGRGLRLAVRTAARALAGRDAWVNVLRTTVACFAGAAGGADAITVLPYSHAAGLPDGFARRLARNTQIVLKEESNLHRVIDPGGGSWFIESLTDAYARAAWTAFQEIEAAGGMAGALLSGRIQARVAGAWADRERAVARRRDTVTGVNEYPYLAETPPAVASVDLDRLRAAGKGRAAAAPAVPVPADAGLDALAEAAARGAALPVLSATRTGTPVRIAALAAHRLGGAYEALRDASDRALATHGTRPRILLACLGPLADHTARSTFARNYFEAGGIEAVAEDVDAATAAAALARSGARLAAICGSDTIYQEQAAGVAAALKGAGALEVIPAGRPGDLEPALVAAGVGRFIHAGDDTLATLRALARTLGVIEA